MTPGKRHVTAAQSAVPLPLHAVASHVPAGEDGSDDREVRRGVDGFFLELAGKGAVLEGGEETNLLRIAGLLHFNLTAQRLTDI